MRISDWSSDVCSSDLFAWGYRAIIVGEYNDVIFGWTFRPQLGVQWDIHGTAPYPIQNFVEGRQQYDFGTTINVTEALSTRINYTIFTGGGAHNTLRDQIGRTSCRDRVWPYV